MYREQSKALNGRSAEALSHDYERLLYRAAFARLDAAEMAKLNEGGETQRMRRHRERNYSRLRSRETARRGWQAVGRTLPRLAQAAACLIAVLAIGFGAALAVSSETRSWAAGMLVDHGEMQFFDEDETSFAGAVPTGGEIYISDTGNDTICAFAADGRQTATYARGADTLDNVVRDRLFYADGAFYALATQLITGEDQGHETWETGNTLLLKLALSDDGSFSETLLHSFADSELYAKDGSTHGNICDALLSGDRLYICSAYSPNPDSFDFIDENRLLCYSLADGRLTELALPEAEAVFAGPEGAVYAVGMDYDAKSGEVFRIAGDAPEKCTTIDWSDRSFAPDGFACDAAQGILYFQCDGSLYAQALQAGAQMRRVSVLRSDTPRRGIVLDDGSYAAVGSRSVEIFNTRADAEDVQVLRVDSQGLPNDIVDAFMDAHPGVAVEQANTEMQEIERGSAEVDVYSVNLSDAEGIGVPLTDPVFQTLKAQMVSTVRERASKGGELCMLPVNFRSVYSLIVFPEIMEKLGLSEADLPVTWADYLQMLKGYADAPGDVPIIMGGSADALERCAQSTYVRMVSAWISDAALRGEAPDFDSEEFRALMDALKEIRFDRLKYADGDYALFWPNADAGIAETVVEGGIPLTLRVRAESRGIVEASEQALLINPNSKNQELAMEFMKFCAEHLSSLTQMGLLEGRPAEEIVKTAFDADDPAMSLQSIEKYRAMNAEVGFSGTGTLDYDALQAIIACGAEYLKGEIDFTAFAEQMNAAAVGK